jgi:hypothetical protein
MVPGSLAVSTIKAAAAGVVGQAVSLGLVSAQAAALTEGAIKAMFITKLKSFAAVVLALGLLTSGAGMMTLTADEPRPGDQLVGAKKAEKPGPGDAPKQIQPFPLEDRWFLEAWMGAHQDEAAQRWQKRAFDQLAAAHHPSMRKLVNCQACHQAKANPKLLQDDRAETYAELMTQHFLGKPRTAWFMESGDILIVRIPKKSTPEGDSEFLRRVCLDVAGRTPTPLEMHYFLKDTDPQKHKKAVEKLAGDSAAVINAKPPTVESRAEDYVKEKLGKKQLTPEERALVQKVLEFSEKEKGK